MIYKLLYRFLKRGLISSIYEGLCLARQSEQEGLGKKSIDKTLLISQIQQINHVEKPS